MLWFFGLEACGILASQPGVEPTYPALEGKILTNGSPGKSHISGFYGFSDSWKLRFQHSVKMTCRHPEHGSFLCECFLFP